MENKYFGENISFFRKKAKITQEELAEKLNVSRQTVSRWENDSSLPDVEMLITLCDLFNCDMDTLVRKNAKDIVEDNEAESQITLINDNNKSNACEGQNIEVTEIPLEYDRHMNKFARLISIGVALILIGISVMFLINSITSYEILSVVCFLLFVACAISLFIFGGILHDSFKKESPDIPPYPRKEVLKGNKYLAIAVSIATTLILIGVCVIILFLYDENRFPSIFRSYDAWSSFVIGIFFIFLSISVFIYVYSGIMKSKLNVEKYNDEKGEKKHISPQQKIGDAVGSIIMMIATGVFLVLGFAFHLWHPGWICFPIGGILSSIVSVFFEIFKKNN